MDKDVWLRIKPPWRPALQLGNIDMVKIVRQMTEEKRAEILRLWNLGYSSSKIAAEIGLSRNSVIGAVHRMRQAGVEIISKERVKSKKVSKPKAPKPPKKDPFYNNPVDILGLRRSSCRFIVEEGSPEATKYCNQIGRAHV